MRYSAAMQKRVSHPFTVHIRAHPRMRGRFEWAIRRGGRIVRETPSTYETFEDARLFGKAALEEVIAAWRHDAASSEAA